MEALKKLSRLGSMRVFHSKKGDPQQQTAFLKKREITQIVIF